MSERHVTVDIIIEAVSAVTGVSRIDIVADRRDAAAVRARFAVFWLAGELTNLASGALGRAVGDRDHATALGAMRRAAELRASDPDFRIATDTMLATLCAIERRGMLRLARSADPIEAARRVLARPAREAVRVAVHEIVAMADLIVATFGSDDEPTPSPFSEPAQETAA